MAANHGRISKHTRISQEAETIEEVLGAVAGVIVGFAISAGFGYAYAPTHGAEGYRPLPGRTLLVALAFAILGALAALVAEDVLEFLLLSLFLLPLVVVAVTDLEARVIPNRVIYPALLLAIGLSWAWPDRGIVEALIGLSVGFGFMLFPFLLSGGRGIAAGDVKLAGFIGAAAGFPNLLPGLLIGVVVGGVAAVVIGLAARSVRATFAYGPYLALGGAIALLAGGEIVDWYTD